MFNDKDTYIWLPCWQGPQTEEIYNITTLLLILSSYVKEEVLYLCIHNRRVSVTLWFENKHKLSQKLASPWNRDSSPTGQFTDTHFEDSSPTKLKTVHRQN